MRHSDPPLSDNRTQIPADTRILPPEFCILNDPDNLRSINKFSMAVGQPPLLKISWPEAKGFAHPSASAHEKFLFSM
jgi:hypothetical protein